MVTVRLPRRGPVDTTSAPCRPLLVVWLIVKPAPFWVAYLWTRPPVGHLLPWPALGRTRRSLPRYCTLNSALLPVGVGVTPDPSVAVTRSPVYG